MFGNTSHASFQGADTSAPDTTAGTGDTHPTMPDSPFKTFVEALLSQANQKPDKRAFTYLVDGERQEEHITFGELDRRARAVARYLLERGAPGDRAVLFCPQGLDFIVAWFGCVYAGIVAVPAYPPKRGRSLNRLLSILSDADANFAITSQALLSESRELIEQDGNVALHWFAPSMAPDAGDWSPALPAPDTIAFLQYTSGSTAAPKGVMVSHGNLITNAVYIKEATGAGDDTISVSWLPQFHDMGLIGGILLPLYLGVHGTLMSHVHFLQRPGRWLDAISRMRATHSGGPTFAWQLLASKAASLDLTAYDLSCWRVAFNSAEPIRHEIMTSFIKALKPCGVRDDLFMPCYGLAESTLGVTFHRYGNEPITVNVDPAQLKQGKLVEGPGRVLVSSGVSPAGQDVRIVDPLTCKECTPGTVGEIWVQGPSVAKGYWNKPDVTDQVFNARIAGVDTGPYLRTGDLGVFHDRELVVTGRLKDLIIIRGANHYPEDIEVTVADAHPALRPGCGAVFSIDEDGEERLVVVHEVERTSLRDLDVEDVALAIRRVVSEQHELEVYAVVLIKTATLLKTSSGKIQRQANREAYLRGELPVVGKSIVQVAVDMDSAFSGEIDSATPSSGRRLGYAQIREILIVRIAHRLKVDARSIDDHVPFTSLGLSSLAAVQLAADLESELGRALSPTLAFEYPTIDLLAHFLAGGHNVQDADQRGAGEPVAIVGMACRFPGADNVDAFWDVLTNGRDAITEVPADRWNVDEVYDPNPATPGKTNTRWGGFVHNADQFDAAFFGISPREAATMDPQQRLLMETAWEALENAGVPSEALTGSSTGAFVGIGPIDYVQLQLLTGAENDAYVATGNSQSIAANRLSYALDLRGPSVAIDTACSSSLVAVHQACQSLRNRECSMALAGGVSAIVTPFITIALSQARMMSSDGHCKAFDASADGYVRSEGCGMIVLKRLSDALRDGDNIWAVVRGTAVNHDGRSNGLTAPNGLAQQAVIRAALRDAGVAPHEVGNIEAHGTGTPVGDPIEIEALKAVLLDKRGADQPCTIGSVKTNIGHLETAAGIAGIIKAVLALKHESIPAHLHLNKMNPLVRLEGTPLTIPTDSTPWPSGTKRRITGVSAFGFGGANAHAVLEEAPRIHAKSSTAQFPPRDVVVLSARSEDALRDMLVNTATWIEANSDAPLRNVAYTTQTARTFFEHRVAVVTQPLADETTRPALVQALKALAEGKSPKEAVTGKGSGRSHPKLAFLFTGQGAQFAGMGKQLYETQPRFREVVDTCDAFLMPRLGRSLKAIMFGDVDEAKATIDQTAFTQPSLFVLEYAVAEMWRSFGIAPDVVMGHSVGEIAACCFAGVFSLEDGLTLIAERGRLIQSLPSGGGMAAVFTEHERAIAAIKGYEGRVSIAAVNGPNLCVVSGELFALEEILAKFAADGIRTTKMSVSHAFHSPLMAPILDDFRAVVQRISLAPLQIPLASNKLGRMMQLGETFTPDFWVEHISEAVLFDTGMKALADAGCEIMLEVGPANTLVGMGKRCIPDTNATWLTSLAKDADNWAPVLASAGALWTQGFKLDWTAVHGGATLPKVALPSYPFQRKQYLPTPSTQRLARFGIQALASARGFNAALGQDTTLQTDSLSTGELSNWFYTPAWEKTANLNGLHQIERNRWLILAGASGFGNKLADALTAQQQDVVLVRAGAEFSESDGIYTIDFARPDNHLLLMQHVFAAGPCKGIVDLRALDAASNESLGADTILAASTAPSMGALYALQGILKHSTAQNAPKLYFVTQGAQATSDDAHAPSLAQAPLWGFARCVGIEHREAMGKAIDLDPAKPSIEALASELLHDDPERLIALRTAGRYVSRLTRHDLKSDANAPSYHADATYLLTGGLGGLGVAIANAMVDRGARRFLVLSRTSLPERRAWGTIDAKSRAGEYIAAIKTLEKRGVTVHAMTADVCDLSRLTSCIETFEAEGWPAIRGVVHAAGVLQDTLLHQMDGNTFATVARPKILGAWNLHTVFANKPLDFFALFSSAASLLGSVSQGNYAVANAFLDTFAAYRTQLGFKTVSINWGPWSDIGMAARPDRGARLATHGMHGIEPRLGVQAFSLALAQGTPQIAVLNADWNELNSYAGGPDGERFLAHLVLKGTVTAPSADVQRIHDAPSGERHALILAYLRGGLARVLHSDPDTVPTDQSVVTMGLDSIMVMDLIRGIERDLQFRVHPREVFEQPTLVGLANYINTELDIMQQRTSGEAPPDGGYIRAGLEKARKAIPIAPRIIPERKNPPCVFLLSAPRSGSTLLRVMLAGHGQLFSPPELHILHFHSMSDHRKMLVDDFNLGDGLQRAVMELRGVDAEASRAIIEGWIEQDKTIQEVYATLQREAAPRLLVDKSPTYTGNPDTLLRAEDLFDGAKYIYLFRHPYSVIESYVRNRTGKMFNFGHVDPYLLAEEVWASHNEHVLDFLKNVDPERQYRVRYEEMVKDPDEVMRGLCNFLGVDWDDGILNPYGEGRMTDGVHKTSRAIGDPNFMKHDRIDPALADVWRNIQLPRSLGEYALRVASELNYDLPNESEPARAAGGPSHDEELEEDRI